MSMKIAALGLVCSIASLSLQASDFDTYLQDKKILNAQYQIQDRKQLNEILEVLSAEDSKTLPIKIDENLIIEQFSLTANHSEIKGLIITPDFSQFEQEMGTKEVKKLIHHHLQKNCSIFYEHQYQRQNPYKVEFKLSSPEKSYELELKQQDCKL
ncbi:hypothetical protein A3K93_05700 [Acinetobacter sp. NCu2D-2]|uniref:hypothetical protein n=1 Tax=Acinetobacter sp. NCu2D-2 TaxID=1608473 RepID=UPI0007CDD17A|nr:hypothetical protein [Acinetobacter sp. NCu2D-2]ANF81727.1 hypothetical protein A3K93_05700 [Acinetobacter sp. NCu2D-2]